MGRLEENFLRDSFADEEGCSVSDEEQDICDNHILDHLCGKVIDEVMDEGDMHLTCDSEYIHINHRKGCKKSINKLKRKRKGFKVSKKKWVIMKGIFWNSRGLKDLAKSRFLSKLSKEQKLYFIALLETDKDKFANSWLNNIYGGKDFLWHWTRPKGGSGGILLGINLDLFDVASIDEREFYIKFHLRNKEDAFQWNLVAVYGASQDEFKQDFLLELVNSFSKEALPMVIGGDFNITRNTMEKNNERYNDRWPFLFNAVIDNLNLREILLSGRKFIWANSMLNQTYEKLDRVLVSTEWEIKNPLVTVHALCRDLSDHTPLVLDIGKGTNRNAQPLFKFELGCLLRDDFQNLLVEIWSKGIQGATNIERWQNKICRLR